MAGKSRNKRRSRPRRQRARKARPNPRKTARAKARRKPARTRKAPAKQRRRTVARRKATRRTKRAKATQRGPKRAQKVARTRIQKVIAVPPTRPKSRARRTERPALDRRRRVLPDEERLEMGAAAARAEAGQDRMLSAARSGHNELRSELGRHTEASPEMTAGDVDARWQDAYALGDEAPGGDNPTPDQDRVDDIGRALGIQYQDNQELRGGDEVTERDKHRWELDPASSDDWPHEKE